MSAENNLQQLGIELPTVPTAGGNYVHAAQSGNMLYLSGKLPSATKGKLGADLSIEDGYAAAREVGLYQLAVLKQTLGSLDRVARIVKVLGMVNATPDFEQHPAVINGFSDLMVEVFGEKGRHARSAVGMGSLPRRLCVEVEMIVEIS